MADYLYAQAEEELPEEDRLREAMILRKYPLLALPPLSYFGPRRTGSYGTRLAAPSAFDSLFLCYEPLDVRAKRGDRKRRAPLEIAIAEEDKARSVPLRSSAVHGHRRNRDLNNIDLYPKYHALGEQYRACGINFDMQERNYSMC